MRPQYSALHHIHKGSRKPLGKLRSLRVRLVGWVGWVFPLTFWSSSCDESSDTAERALAAPVSSQPSVKRGSRVVVERTAGEFLEATVLREQDGFLHLQTTNGAESLRVARTDVYAVERQAKKTEPGRYAICGVGRLLWSGCKVLKTTDAEVVIATPDSKQMTLSPARVLEATELTRMNIREQFSRQDRRQEFLRQLAEADGPSPPSGWRAAPRERVVVRRRSDWFTARVHEIEDDGIRVKFKGHTLPEKVETREVIPEPPYRYHFRRGDFALMRPQAAADPWVYVRVRAATNELKVEDASGDTSHVDDTEVIPMPRR